MRNRTTTVLIAAGVVLAAVIVSRTPGQPREGATGLCCLPGGSCGVFTEFDCLSSDGDYAGDNTHTGGASCDWLCSDGQVCVWYIQAPHGACCLPDGSCVFTTVDECVGPSGPFRGQYIGGSCEDAGCTAGVCCIGGDECSVAADFHCCRLHGVYWGDGTGCDEFLDCPPACVVADIDDDNMVGISDFLLLLAQWGPCPPLCIADLDGDGTVGIIDFLLLLASWGPCL